MPVLIWVRPTFGSIGPGTTTQGRSFDEALANLKEATALYLSEFPLPRSGRAVMTTFEIATADA
jgi:predicted RNase H-like HicB family nuclease